MSRHLITGLDIGSSIETPKLKQTSRRQAEKDEVDGHHIVQNLFIASRNRDDDGKNTLKNDGRNRNFGPSIEHTYGFEKQAIVSHREIHPGSRQDALAEKTKSRYRNTGGDQNSACFTQSFSHHIRRWSRRCCKMFHSENSDAHHIYRQI